MTALQSSSWRERFRGCLGSTRMSDRRAESGPRGRTDPDPHLAALERAELRRHRNRLQGAVARHALRAFLGAAPLVLGMLPQFRVGLLYALLLPLALLVVSETRRALAAYRELQVLGDSSRAPYSSGDADSAP